MYHHFVRNPRTSPWKIIWRSWKLGSPHITTRGGNIPIPIPAMIIISEPFFEHIQQILMSVFAIIWWFMCISTPILNARNFGWMHQSWWFMIFDDDSSVQLCKPTLMIHASLALGMASGNRSVAPEAIWFFLLESRRSQLPRPPTPSAVFALGPAAKDVLGKKSQPRVQTWLCISLPMSHWHDVCRVKWRGTYKWRSVNIWCVV